ncbi:MAG TPA: hypothetical protein ENL10_02875 [Candidatus Cloacimonetes bacterium]|nr:hypothetical protein [Candidatus Cloacimonadota bacterium]
MIMNNDFEEQWIAKLHHGLIKIGKEYLYDEIEKSIRNDDPVDWSQKLMNFLSQRLTEEEIKQVMCSCACLTPKDNLKHIREEYTRTKDIQHVHNLLQQQFESFIREYKNLDDDQIDFLRENGWGMAGKLDGNVIYATKIPKEFHKYFAEKDERKKQYYYCHCPRIRETILENRFIDLQYCYCGAGFYKDIWEYITQGDVQVEVLESILKGDKYCKIAIYL